MVDTDFQHRPVTGWCITTGKAGHEQQALGILESLVKAPLVKHVNPGGFRRFFAPYYPVRPTKEIAPPWPDIVVTSGRRSAAFARMISKRSGGRTFTAVLQNPKAPPHWFDFMWANEHDNLSGPNVLKTLTAPHRIRAERLVQDGELLAQRLGNLTGPFVSVILGGPNSAYPFSEDDARLVGRQVADLAASRGASVLITPSRRTGAERLAAIIEGVGDVPHWAWDGSGENPYFGILGLGDEIVATCDSVNMLGEAAATGKPVHIARLPGKDSKFDQFHHGLIDAGAAHWLDDLHPFWSYESIDAHKTIVSEILRRYDTKMRKRQQAQR